MEQEHIDGVLRTNGPSDQTKHSDSGCMAQDPLDFPPGPISGIPRYAISATQGPAGCVMHKLLSPKPFTLLLLLSKHAFIFHEAEQGRATSLGSAACLLLTVEMYTMFGKCLHAIYMTGRQPHHKCTSGVVCSSNVKTFYESVSG